MYSYCVRLDAVEGENVDEVEVGAPALRGWTLPVVLVDDNVAELYSSIPRNASM